MNTMDVDLIGHSAYFQYSHKPALDSLGIPIANIANRTPINNVKTTGGGDQQRARYQRLTMSTWKISAAVTSTGSSSLTNQLRQLFSDMRDYLAMSSFWKTADHRANVASVVILHEIF